MRHTATSSGIHQLRRISGYQSETRGNAHFLDSHSLGSSVLRAEIERCPKLSDGRGGKISVLRISQRRAEQRRVHRGVAVKSTRHSRSSYIPGSLRVHVLVAITPRALSRQDYCCVVLITHHSPSVRRQGRPKLAAKDIHPPVVG